MTPEPGTSAGRTTEEPAPSADAIPSAAPAREEPRVGVGREAEAARIVRKYVFWSGGAGLLPIPLIDVVSVLSVQLKMLSDLGRLYGVPFSEQRGKALIGALTGSVGSMAIGRPLVARVLAVAVPVGWPWLLASSATASAATTYALGRVFTYHFELGGTLLDFRPERTRAFFEAELHRTAGSGRQPIDRAKES